MPELKLARLPDRTPVKLTISVLPDLHQRLGDYAALYASSTAARNRCPNLSRRCCPLSSIATVRLPKGVRPGGETATDDRND